MKIGISTASLFLKQETEQALITVKELGTDCVEIFLATFYEFRPEFAKNYKDRCDGLDVCSVHPYGTAFEPQLFNRSRRTSGDAFYWLDQIMRSAQLFGAEKYSFHGIIRKGGEPDIGYLGERLSKAVSFCAEYGVNLCLENVCWSTYNSPYIFKQLKKYCPQLLGVLDLKQARRSGYPYAMYIEDMKGSISHVHLSDVTEKGKMCLPGRGVTDFNEIFLRLKDSGFDGEALIEVYPEDFSDFSELKTSLEFLKEINYKIG